MNDVKDLLILQAYSNKQTKNLSGGNKRKLCCAMALIKTPKLIFMDEASNGMDPIVRKRLYSYLKSLKGTSTLLITHRIDEAEKICCKIAIMSEGAFLDMDHPNILKERHGLVFVLRVELASNSVSEEVNDRICFTLPFCKRLKAMGM